MAILINNLEHSVVRAICSRYDNRPDALLEILHETQETEGYLNDETLTTIARALNISRADIHGVVSFYHDYRREAPARHIVKICLAEACQAVGCEVLAAAAEAKFGAKIGGAKSVDRQIGLEAAYCLGNCALGPSVMIDGALYGRVTPDRLTALVKDRSTAEVQKS